jgi:hypothetical protein
MPERTTWHEPRSEKSAEVVVAAEVPQRRTERKEGQSPCNLGTVDEAETRAT